MTYRLSWIMVRSSPMPLDTHTIASLSIKKPYNVQDNPLKNENSEVLNGIEAVDLSLITVMAVDSGDPISMIDKQTPTRPNVSRSPKMHSTIEVSPTVPLIAYNTRGRSSAPTYVSKIIVLTRPTAKPVKLGKNRVQSDFI